MDKNNLIYAAVAGAITGSLAWLVLKPFVDRQMEDGIRQQLQVQLPQQLSAQLDTKLAQYGITPELGQQVTRLVQTATRTGVL